MADSLRKSFFSLRIPSEEFIRVYEGSAKYVVTRSYDGRNIRFPANILRQFLTHDGIFGEFVIYYDQHNKFQEIKKIG
ncbi:MAG: DUF2835 domain-containing protein [Gammaproteobacteria bacterium]|nr:DUF2835 domain-containing protein [Gammaproteobacteria bacterium]